MPTETPAATARNNITRILSAVFVNGVTEVSANMNDDVIEDTLSKFHLNETFDNLLKYSPFSKDMSPSVRRIVYVGLMLLFADRKRVEPNCATQEKFGEAAQENNVVWGVNQSSIVTSDVNRAWLVVFASKVNFYQTNHHTGRSRKELQGYMAKIFEIMQLQNPTEDDISAIWMLCHYFDTKRALRALGMSQSVTDDWGSRMAICNPTVVFDDSETGEFATPGHDVKLRALSHPAGTAQYFDCYNVLKSLQVTSHSAIVMPVAWKPFYYLEAVLKDVESNPARYHMGAKYLTGVDRIILKQIPDTMKGLVGACCATFLKGSSIAKASSLSKYIADAATVASMSGITAGVSKGAMEGAAKMSADIMAGHAAGLPPRPSDDEMADGKKMFV